MRVTKIKKYLLFPGHVVSKDGDEHYVRGQDLAGLYGVPFWECCVATSDTAVRHYRTLRPRLIELTVRPDGDYREHLAAINIFSELGD